MIKGDAEKMLDWLQEGDLFVVDRGFTGLGIQLTSWSQLVSGLKRQTI